MNRPNPRCFHCDMCACVDTYPTGVRMSMDERYYQCLAGIEYECLPDGEHVSEHVSLYEEVV